MKKLRSKKGMSLAEVLITVAIFSVVLVAATTGGSTVLRVYRQVREKADAETLLSTSILAVSEDLYDASEVTTSGNNAEGFNDVSYFYNEKLNYNETFVTGENSSGSKVIQKVYCDVNSDFDTETGDKENTVADKTQSLGLYTVLVNDKLEFESGGCFRFTVAVYSNDGRKIDEQTAYVHSSLILE